MELIAQEKRLLRGQKVHFCHWEGREAARNVRMPMWIILWARLGEADRKNIHTNYAKEIDFSFILLKHVNETPTVSKAKIDWADFAGFQEAEDVSHSPQWWVFSIIFLSFFFFVFSILLETTVWLIFDSV